MRKVYKDFFYSPKHGKISEKFINSRIVKTIAVMIVCLFAMSVTAYAYFSCSITSSSNILEAASFKIDVKVEAVKTKKNSEENKPNLVTSDHKNYKIEGLEVGEWYEITVEQAEGNTAQTGFIIVSSEDCKKTYHTQQLGLDKSVSGGKTKALKFKLMITDSTDVILKSNWGTSSFYSDFEDVDQDDERYIIQDEEIEMVINDFEEPNIKIPDVETKEPNIEIFDEETEEPDIEESSTEETPENTEDSSDDSEKSDDNVATETPENTANVEPSDDTQNDTTTEVEEDSENTIQTDIVEQS